MRAFIIASIKLNIAVSILSSCASNQDRFIESYAKLRETEEVVAAYFKQPELMMNPIIRKHSIGIVLEETNLDILALEKSYVSALQNFRHGENALCFEIQKLVQECCRKFGAIADYSKLGKEGGNYIIPWNDCFSVIHYYEYVQLNNISPSSLSLVFER